MEVSAKAASGLRRHWKAFLGIIGVPSILDVVKEWGRGRIVDMLTDHLGGFGRWLAENPFAFFTLGLISAIIFLAYSIIHTDLKPPVSVILTANREPYFPPVRRFVSFSIVVVLLCMCGLVGYGSFRFWQKEHPALTNAPDSQASAKAGINKEPNSPPNSNSNQIEMPNKARPRDPSTTVTTTQQQATGQAARPMQPTAQPPQSAYDQLVSAQSQLRALNAKWVEITNREARRAVPPPSQVSGKTEDQRIQTEGESIALFYATANDFGKDWQALEKEVNIIHNEALDRKARPGPYQWSANERDKDGQEFLKALAQAEHVPNYSEIRTGNIPDRFTLLINYLDALKKILGDFKD